MQLVMWNRRLNGYGLEDVLGFIKQNAYGAPQGVCCFLSVFNERNQKCASHNPRERHPTQPACCLYLSAQRVTVMAWFLMTPRWNTNISPDSESSSQRVFPFVYRAGFTSEQSPAMFNSDLALNTHILTGHPEAVGSDVIWKRCGWPQLWVLTKLIM